MSKTSRSNIENSIDGIFSGLKIQNNIETKEQKEDDILNLKRKLKAYEELGSIGEIQKLIQSLQQEKEQLESKVQELRQKQPKSSLTKTKSSYLPSQVIHQYCENSEGKRKLTIHLREIDYQAILQTSRHFRTTKGLIMETITQALRAYIPQKDYKEAEREVSEKALRSVQGILESVGVSSEEIEDRLRRDMML